MYCPACHHAVSATEKFSILSCDRCQTDYVTNTTVEYLASRDRSSREIILSGIRATGALHLGIYLGAIRQFVEYELRDNLCMYFIADWHTLTTCHDPRKVSLDTLAVAMDYLAAGLNPERSIIYAQSSVPETAELALCLSMIQSKNRLEDLPTVKNMIRSGETMSMGHLQYPVLMAADILGPKATLVPVGSDQIPNVELVRDLAEKFNRQFGQTFTIPRMGLRTIKIPGFRGEKMGEPPTESGISLQDRLEDISDKYARFGITDTGRKTRNDPGNPNNCVSVYPVYKVLRENKPDALQIVEKECLSGTRGCRECKLELAREIDELISPFRERRTKLMNQQKYVEEILHYGGMKAREIVRHTLEEVREKMGIVSF
jgi:tryptophanyl-tRNA synthetase